MRLHWILPSTLLGILMLSSTASAARLKYWHFDESQNQLQFDTDETVQPKAQLIFNPTRLVIDLPGTYLERPNVTESFNGAIRGLRIGQVEENVTRIVIDVSPGYTLDPQQVKVRPDAGGRWTVQLPRPELAAASSSKPTYSVVNATSNSSNNTAITSRVAQATSGPALIESVQVTNGGFFVRTSGGEKAQISVNRSDDRQTINIEFKGASLSPNLVERDLIVGRYGVKRVQLTQVQASLPVARMTLRVDKTSPDWNATFSTFGGVVVLPQGGVATIPNSNSNPTPTNSNTPRPIPPISNSGGNTTPAIIQALELGNGGRQLVIRANQPLNFTNGWDRASGQYRITINNAQISSAFKGPNLNANSPVLRVRLQRPDARTVVILITPSPTTQIGELNQLSSQLLALELQPSRVNYPPIGSNPSPSNPNSPYPSPSPSPYPNQPVPHGRIVVIIDPGHGGKDSGAPGLRGILEKDVVLPLGEKLASILQQNGIQVYMTRNADYFVDLAPRVEMADRVHADLFVSIHANSVDDRPDVNGLETYYFDSGLRLAQVVHRSVLDSIGTIKDRGVRKARFYVLRKSSMPSILVETGYMTGREDNPRLATSEYQSRMAAAIARGVLQYLQQR